MRLLRVLLHDLQRSEEQIAAHLDVLQLRPSGKGCIQKLRHAQRRAVIDPVSAVDDPNRLLRRAELGAVFRAIIHCVPS